MLENTAPMVLPDLGSAICCRFHNTSSTVTGVPSCQTAFWRRRSAMRVLSAFQPNSSIRPGASDRSSFCSMNVS